MTLQAWYTHTIASLASNSPYVADYIEIPGYAVSTTDSTVEVGTDDVIVTSGTTVVITEDILTNRSSLFSFLTMVNSNFTISKYNSSSFTDWKTAGSGTGADYSSYLVTGYEMFNDIMRKKQAPYIFFYFNRTEDGFSLSGANLLLDN